ESVVQEWCREMSYEAVAFEALDQNGRPIYHTNVLMCIGERLAILGSEAMKPADRDHVRDRLLASGREVIEISHSQIAQFAGNVLELASWDEALGDCRVLVMSTTARAAFSEADFARLSACTDTVLTVPVPTIERLGGGGVRCMLAEVFLPE
ncbi:MAG TPA: arginine deiminase-related protein, partial [Steroidobacteraceae bacterium]